MLLAGNDASNASLLKCGYLLDPGKLRMSATVSMLKECSIETKRSSVRVEWPIVHITFPVVLN